MKHQDFWMRAASLVIAVAALGIYQANALQWQKQEEANQLAVQEAQQHNAKLTEANTSSAISYIDGTYTGSGQGFGGTVSVEVTVKDSKISAIEITSASGEDAAYLDMAKQMIDNMIAAQTPDVDTISGATYSSNGIKTAVQEALKDAVQESKPEESAAGATYTDGTYTGSGQGFGGTVSVEVTVKDGKISAIDITSANGEDAAYLDMAKQMIDSMISAQSADVDTISGATYSSNGIKTAVQEALKGAAEA